MEKSIEQIRDVFARARENAMRDPSHRDDLRNRYYRVLSSDPYNLTLDDFARAYEDPILNPEPSDPWGGGMAGSVRQRIAAGPDATSGGKADRDVG